MHARYKDEMTMLEARRVYFDVNHFGEDGGYGDAWVDFKLGPIPMPFPNSPARVRAVRFHDLHHVLTGYDTDTKGEFEISAWELAAGCKGFVAAWALNLGGLAAGVFSCPVRTFRAFVRGRRDRTTYGEDLDALLGTSVGDARKRFVAREQARAGVSDFVWFGLATIAGIVEGLALFALILPLVPFGVVAGMLRKKTAPQPA